MTNSLIIVILGTCCAIASAGLAWVCLSRGIVRRSLQRVGINPGEPIGSLDDEKLLAYGRYIDSRRVLAGAAGVLGVVAVLLIAYGW